MSALGDGIFEVETIVRERRFYRVRAASLDAAMDRVLEAEGEHGEEVRESDDGPRIVVEDVLIHDAREVTEEYRDHDAEREAVRS